MEKEQVLSDRVALVTGASRGIGKSIALNLARAGANVIVSGRSNALLEELIQQIQSEGGNATAFTCDLLNSEETNQLAKNAIECYGQLDILINNAGTAIKKPFDQSSDEEWQRLFTINAQAPFILCRECLPALKTSDRATIINIASVVGIKGYEHQSIYTASKHALMGFTKVLAQEVQPFDIRVHAINPGGVYTDMVKTMRPDLSPEGLIKADEIAEVVLFLLTHRNNAMIDDIHIRRANGTPWF